MTRHPGTARTLTHGRHDLCSNGPVGIEGQALINGDAKAGPGYSTTITGSGNVTGGTTPMTHPLELLSPDSSPYPLTTKADMPTVLHPGNLKDQLSPVDNSNNFNPRANMGGGVTSYTIPEGTYHFNDFIIDGSFTVSTTGKVTIYVDGRFSIDGAQLVNASMNPLNLQILITNTGSTTTALLRSDADFYGTVYAPDRNVEVAGSNDVYGTVTGDNVLVTGDGEVHYDEVLGVLEFPELGLFPYPVLVQ